MAQVISGFGGSGSLASNLGATVLSSETVVLDLVPAFGFYRYGVTIVCSSGAVTACALYGTCDGTHYTAVTGFSTFAVSSGSQGHAEATGVWQMLRLTITGASTVNAYLNAIQA